MFERKIITKNEEPKVEDDALPIEDDKANIGYVGDEYDKDIYYISSQDTKIAIKNVSNFISPYKHEIAETLSAALHSIGQAMTMVHLSGTHLRGPLKYVGPSAEIAADIIHHPSESLIEKIVCGTGVSLLKEVVNVNIAVTCSATIGVVTSAVATPATTYLTIGGVVIGAYKLADKITTPLAHYAQHQCHAMFNPAVKEKVVQQNQPQPKVDTQEIDNFIYLGIMNAQTNITNTLVSALSNQKSIVAKSNNTNLERMQNNLATLQKSSHSSGNINHALTQSTSSTARMIENLKSLNNSQHNFSNCLAANSHNDFSQYTNPSCPTFYTASAAKAAEYSAFSGNYINMNYRERPRPSSNSSSLWGRNGGDSSGRNCDIFGNCSSSNNSNDCGSQDRCSIKR